MEVINKTSEVIQMSGTPRNLLLHGNVPKSLTRDFAVSFHSGGDALNEKQCRFRTRKDKSGTLTSFKAKLPHSTPPGAYKATLKCEEKEFEVEIEVQEKRRLRIHPINIHIEGKPSAKITSHLLFSNKGNVPIEIPDKSIVGIYDDDGIETAFASAYKMESNDAMQLVQKFVEKLRAGHGGLLKIRLLEGAGQLPANTQQAVKAEFQISESVKPGHSYHGVWSIGPAEYAITVTVTK